MTRARKHWKQMTLDDARKPEGRGGWRPGAGRKRGRRKVAHERRADFPKRFPQHVTQRIVEHVPSLRRLEALRIIHDAIRAVGHREDFRVVHFNVLSNHLHFMIEAAGRAALAAGMQCLKSRLGRRLNRLLGRTGTLFADRYHARSLATPAEVRNALRYILLNQQHHDRHGEHWFGVDRFSSAAWFDGWADDRWRHEPADAPQPTAAARTWLLTTGWRRRGLIHFDELAANPAAVAA